MPSWFDGALGAAVALVAIALYHFAFVAPRLRQYDRLLRGEGSTGDSAALSAGDRSAFAAVLKRTDERLSELERTASRDTYRVGFVRYNSFSDVGSDLSFALALLNGEGDGVVLTSIYSREETRTYGKGVRRYLAQQDASKEEQTAIAMARTGIGS
jgi:hypothetical protein